MAIVLPIPAFSDNYIWAIVHKQQAIIVDPGDAHPVQLFLQKQQLNLAGILITHWHKDHTGGIATLKQLFPHALVYGPKHHAIAADIELEDNSNISVAGVNFHALHTPGHTLEHLCYFVEQQQWLFSGDTLFAAGCGRVFEGDHAMMLASLNRLAGLPDSTQIFCAHEYTLSNLLFAQAVEPFNEAINKRILHCQGLRDKNYPTLPSTLAEEKNSNPFLRTDNKDVVQAALNHGAKNTSAVAIFTALREWKNHF